MRFDRVITSPLFRARETAEIIVPGAGVEADPRLKEMDYGAWEGLTYTQIEDATARPAASGSSPRTGSPARAASPATTSPSGSARSSTT